MSKWNSKGQYAGNVVKKFKTISWKWWNDVNDKMTFFSGANLQISENRLDKKKILN